MPYCEQHNEVYRGEECPVCEDELRTPTEESAADIGTVDDLIDDVIDSISKGASSDFQEKEVEETDVTEVDQSTTIVDQSTEVHDERTTVEDSVVNRSDVGGEGRAEVSDSIAKGADIGGEGRTEVEDSVVTGSKTTGRTDSGVEQPTDDRTGGLATGETEYCIHCGEEITTGGGRCPVCGEVFES